jgi:hypothetical protein
VPDLCQRIADLAHLDDLGERKNNNLRVSNGGRGTDSVPGHHFLRLKHLVAAKNIGFGLVVALRDDAAERLKHALLARGADIDRVLVGRKLDGTSDCPPESRVQIIPLPSILILTRKIDSAPLRVFRKHCRRHRAPNTLG